MNVLFAPDYRSGNPYQALLAEALQAEGVQVHFARDYRRGLPLLRLVREQQPDLVHLHWPEAFFPQSDGKFNRLRVARWPVDLALTTRRWPMVLTAHNLAPHGYPAGPLLRRALHATAHQASAVIAHSSEAARAFGEAYDVPNQRIAVIAHGNLAEKLSLPRSQAEARQFLGLAEERIALSFGNLAPYKGLEALIQWWSAHVRPAALWIVGRSAEPAYERALQNLVGENRSVRLILERPDDVRLAQYIMASDVVVFNHQAGLTSGAAMLARSLGARILVPRSLRDTGLGVPHPGIREFDTLDAEFGQTLASILNAPAPGRDPEWWRATSWHQVATATAAVYRRVLRELS